MENYSLAAVMASPFFIPRCHARRQSALLRSAHVLTELVGELVGADALLCCCCVYALPDFLRLGDTPDDRAGLVWGGLGLVLIVFFPVV